ncbi:TetR/AcrR family transcriptional regulator [Paenibacillus sp. 1P07SE]|uniref:TetR/AcrR family transcriptional regulator n=1 Tax=Paenibacillus sp. 1P07SE TaxID=3132209 RepID=UPI0039A426BD
MAATLKLIIAEGLQSVTFAKITKEANVGYSTVYHYYSTKEALVTELFRNTRLHMSEHVLQGFRSDRTVYEKVKHILSRTLTYAKDYPDHAFFIDNYCQSPFIEETVRTMQPPSDLVVYEIIEEGQKQGVIREMDALFLCHIIVGFINSAVRGYYENKYSFEEKHVQFILESCWKVIKV